MIKYRGLFSIAFAVLLFGLSGCASATKEFSRRLRGTWQIINYNVERPNVRSAAVPNYGTITFNKNGTGRLDATNIFLGMERSGQTEFNWANTENIVVIRWKNSEFAKSWIVITNKKNDQVWKSTDGANAVETLELRR